MMDFIQGKCAKLYLILQILFGFVEFEISICFLLLSFCSHKQNSGMTSNCLMLIYGKYLHQNAFFQIMFVYYR